jgi:hypothetical protein
MKSKALAVFGSIAAMAVAMVMATHPSQARDTPREATEPVRMIVTANVDAGKRMPGITKEDIFVKKGKGRLQVTEWTPARGDRGGLELFLLIDDASDTSIGNKLNELAAFIKAQPPATLVGVGYMRNATVQVVQDLTSDHEQAAKRLRLPIGSVGAYGTPYLSVIDLMKNWPPSENRHEIVMVTDGIDRAGRERNALLNPDVDSGADVAKRTGTIIHTIYSPGVGRWHRNFWLGSNGENGIAKLSELTGGESFFLGLQSPVSFEPYLRSIQNILDNQYFIGFTATPGKKPGFQSVTVDTELAGVDLTAADAVWVPGAK